MAFALRFTYVLFLPLLALSCTGKESRAPERAVGRFLEKSYAEYRAALVKNVQYDFSVDLTNPNQFSGVSKIQFDMAEPQELTVDFYDGAIQDVTVNGKVLKNAKYNKYFLVIPEKALLKGANTIQVAYTHAYSATGAGLYRFVDPEDQRVYLYSDFEPYDANRFAPVFDQPDIKAVYATKVLAPKDWTVVSSTLDSARVPLGENVEWTFPRSKKFSTYLYALHAGPYKIWENSAQTPAHKVPLRLMARQSLAKYINPKEWFDNTQKGFVFFEDFFGYPYPYEKYDEVVVPDFNSGAMENVAAVTYNERYVSRSQKTRDALRSQASVQAHELAHMWFGNLVTMKWWNDIWLNESFATYASYRALLAHPQFQDESVNFSTKSKKSAYYEDQLVTTHPIAFDVPNTDVVFANFDSITYGKGASVLKQLAFYLGDEKFKQGLQNYFRKFAFSNTELSDFINELSTASSLPLDDWQTAWLQKAQVNTIKVDHRCADGKTTAAKLIQTAPKDYATMRPHKTEVAVFGEQDKKLKMLKTFTVSYSQANTPLPDLNGLNCEEIALIYPNYNDHDYVVVELDPISLKTVMTKMSMIDDELLKIGLWGSLGDMVVTQKIPATDLFEMVLTHSDNETSTEVLSGNFGGALLTAHHFIDREGPLTAKRQAAIQRLHEYFLKRATTAKDVDLQKFWFDSLVGNAESPEQLKMVAQFLKTAPPWLKFPIDQDRRWSIVHTLNENGFESASELLEAETKRDASARAERMVLASQAAQPNLAVKKQFWNKLTQGPTEQFPLGKLGAVASSLFPSSQEKMHRRFKDEIFTSLKKLKDAPSEVFKVYLAVLPAFCATESVNELQSFARDNKDLPPNVVKSLKAQAQQSERCVGIRKKIVEAETTKHI